MGCSGGVERGAETCVCSGQTVFEGAVIGQVFTGDVQMQCPHTTTSVHDTSTEPDRPLASALLAIAIWQSWLTLPLNETLSAASLPHAVLFLCCGITARYLRLSHGRALLRCARRFLRSVRRPCATPGSGRGQSRKDLEHRPLTAKDLEMDAKHDQQGCAADVC